MRTDTKIKADVEAELQWDARLNGSEIAVTVADGHVMLSGNVSSYPKKLNAEKAARRVAGVLSVNNLLVVSIPEASRKSDEEIARSVENSIKWNSSIDDKRINVTVKDGCVTLEGKVDWAYQSSKARFLAEDITGVRAVANLITVVSNSPSPSDIKERIRTALLRNHYLNTNKIMIEVSKGKAILRGKVKTLAEKGAAENAAWSAPGINEVVNELVVDYSETFA
jgi:osmotically-inducible protein OsmY